MTLSMGLVSLAHTQDYPSKSIRSIEPFGAGGPTDTQARWAVQKVNAAFGQAVIVDNRPAVGGLLGMGGQWQKVLPTDIRCSPATRARSPSYL